MRKEFEGEGWRDFLDRGFSEDDLLQEARLFACRGSGTGKGVVDEVLERILAVLVVRVADLGNDLGRELGTVDGLGVKAFGFAAFDVVEVC